MDLSVYPWSEEEVQVFVQENLVLRVSSAEVLEKCVRQGHDLIHLLVILWQDADIQTSHRGFRSHERQAGDVFGRYKPSRRGSAAGPAPQCGRPCSLAAFAAASDSSYLDSTAY